MKFSNLLAGSLVCCSMVAATANAAVCNFTGVVDSAIGAYPVADIGDSIAFSVTFGTVGGGGGVAGVISAATLSVGGQIYNLGPAGSSTNMVTLIDNGTNALLRFDIALAASTPGGLPGGDLDLQLQAPNGLFSDFMLTQANVDLVKANNIQGDFGWFPSAGVGRGGSIAAVPEPASVIAMSCVGLFFVGGAVRRRKKQNAEQLESIAV